MENKGQYLQIRVTRAEKTAIKAAAERAGMDMSAWVLERLLPARPAIFRGLMAALGAEPARRRYLLAELNDFLSSTGPHELPQITADPAPTALEPYLANYVAAMVETAAHRADVPPPSWTADIAGLAEPTFGAPFPGLRLHLLLNSPPAFRRRNIFINATLGSRV
jgi:hypothetical protein